MATERVLVVEDEAFTSLLVSDALTSLGFEVESHPDGESALRSALQSKVALAIIDVGLPGMTGDRLAQVLRDVQPKTPIVLMTGYGAQPYREQFGDWQDFQVLEKPFEEWTLVRVLNSLGITSEIALDTNADFSTPAKGELKEEDRDHTSSR